VNKRTANTSTSGIGMLHSTVIADDTAVLSAHSHQQLSYSLLRGGSTLTVPWRRGLAGL